MKESGCDIYIHFNTDFHHSEYVGDCDRFISYLTGFTGSNATVLVSHSQAILWTDGRYFLQAQREIEKYGFILYKQNTDGYDSLSIVLEKNLKKGCVLCFDGRYISKNDSNKFSKIAQKNRASLVKDFNPIDSLWKHRPEKKITKAWILDEKYSGKSTQKKLRLIRTYLRKRDYDGLLLNDLCDIAWTLNMRANDVEFVPVMYSFLYISLKEIVLFVNGQSLDEKVVKYLRKETRDKISICSYDSVFGYFSKLNEERIVTDFSVISDAILSDSPCFINKPSYVNYLRSIKNGREIKNIRESHIADGVALTKMIYRLKSFSKGKGYYKNSENLTEYQVSKDLSVLRSRIKGYVSDSFNTIAAYGENAAMMHYAPEESSCSVVEKKGFLLIDSGGHYLKGTTDVTRTVAMGPLSDEEKYNYTRVLKGHLNLMNAVFAEGTCGENLDILARAPFYETGEDYRSGTGHGVGYLLSVHEGPNAIRSKSRGKTYALKPGMITTDEPGYYKDKEYGIRIENELLCKHHKTTDYGKFLCFEAMTFVPYERDAIIESMLTEKEKVIFNEYNQRIFGILKDKLTKQEQAWLKEVTSKL